MSKRVEGDSGKCPKCNGEDLEYRNPIRGFKEESWEVSCPNCDFTGRAIWIMKFAHYEM